MKTKLLLLSLLIIFTFYNCSSTQNSKITTEKFTNTPKIKGKYNSYKINSTFNQKQRVLAFLKQQGDFNVTEISSELTTISYSIAPSGLNDAIKRVPLVLLNEQEILNSNSNSLYRIQNMYLSQMDEIFISRRGATTREIHLYTKKK